MSVSAIKGASVAYKPGRVGVSAAYNQGVVCVCVCCLLPRGRVVVFAAYNQGGVLSCLLPITKGACCRVFSL